MGKIISSVGAITKIRLDADRMRARLGLARRESPKRAVRIQGFTKTKEPSGKPGSVVENAQKISDDLLET
jgi:hypothetical protein